MPLGRTRGSRPSEGIFVTVELVAGLCWMHLKLLFCGLKKCWQPGMRNGLLQATVIKFPQTFFADPAGKGQSLRHELLI